MSFSKPAVFRLFALLSVAGVLAALSPPELTLGSSVRLIYLHGAWIWASILTLAGAAGVGLVGLLTRRPDHHRWSAGLGRSGSVFWLVSLLLSLAAMQAGWNGLFLAEPRWRIAAEFAFLAVLVQAGAALIGRPPATSLLNVVFFVALAASLLSTEAVMHPPSPVFTSESASIRWTFVALAGLLTAAGVQLSTSFRPASGT